MPTRWIRRLRRPRPEGAGRELDTPTATSSTGPQGERDGYVFTNVNTVINAWSYKALADMAQIAAALGKTEDAATWGAAAERLRGAINANLFDRTAATRTASRRRTPPSTRRSSPSPWASPARSSSARPRSTSPTAAWPAAVFCANFLIDALYDGGRAADAVRLMTGTGQRSWLHMIEQGAGSPMEAWDPALKSNTTYSHPWSGSPAYLVYRGALGIEALEPGYKRFSVKPQPGGLTRAAGTTPTVRGTVGAAFETVGERPRPRGQGARRTARRSSRCPGKTVEVGAGCHLLSTGAGVTAASVREWATAQGCTFSVDARRQRRRHRPGDARRSRSATRRSGRSSRASRVSTRRRRPPT